jgi:hypothetical protein
MISSNEVIDLIKNLSIAERLMIVEAILRNIREENAAQKESKMNEEPAILSLAGIFDEEEAQVFENAIAESRKIDEDEW